jgi:hypothetical protein
MTPLEQDIKRVSNYTKDLLKLLGINENDSKVKWIERAMANAYQLGRVDGKAEEFYRHYGHEKGEV